MKMRNTIIADRIWNQSVSPMAVRPRMHSPSQTLAPSPPLSLSNSVTFGVPESPQADQSRWHEAILCHNHEIHEESGGCL